MDSKQSTEYIYMTIYDTVHKTLNNGLADYYNNMDKKKIICILIGIFMIYLLLRITSIFIIIIGGFILGLYIYDVYVNTFSMPDT